MEYIFYPEQEDTEEEYWEVDYRIEPITPARYWGHPDDWYEAGGGDIEFTVFNKAKQDITATIDDKTLQDISDKCYAEAEREAEEWDGGY